MVDINNYINGTNPIYDNVILAGIVLYPTLYKSGMEAKPEKTKNVCIRYS